MAVSVPRRAVDARRLVRRELLRLQAADLSVYVHGPAATVRLTDPHTHERASAPAATALAALRALPDGAGARAALDALTQGGH
jgi:hypothetical protein